MVNEKLYEEFIYRNRQNSLTIDRISKSDNKIYLENNSSYPSIIKMYLHENFTIQFEDLVTLVTKYNIHITNPSVIREFFDEKLASISISQTMKDYLKNVSSNIENSKLINDNLFVIEDSWHYQCGPDGEEGLAGYELYATIKDNRFYFIAKNYDEDREMYVKGNTDSFEMCISIYKLSKREVEAVLEPDFNSNYRWKKLSADLKRTNTQIKPLSWKEYEQYKQNILNK